MSLGSRITRGLGRLAIRAPRLALRLSDVIAALAWRRVSPDDVQRVLPHLSPREAKRVAAFARNSEMRNVVIQAMQAIGGLGTVDRLVDPNPRLDELRPPMILGTFHIGAIGALGPALERVAGRVLILRRRPPHRAVRTSLVIESTEGDEQHRALVFHRALEWLNGGDSVFLPLDPEEAVRLSAPFCGHTLQLARGPFAMSRITSAPIVPIIARWRGTRAEIVIGNPIAPAEDESAMAAEAAAWLEDLLTQSPLEISARILELTT